MNRFGPDRRSASTDLDSASLGGRPEIGRSQTDVAEMIELATGISVPDGAGLRALPTAELRELSRAMSEAIVGALAVEGVPRLGFHGSPAEAYDKLARERCSRAPGEYDEGAIWVATSLAKDPTEAAADLVTAAARAYGYRFPSGPYSDHLSPGPVATIKLEDSSVGIWTDDSLVDPNELALVRCVPSSSLKGLKSPLEGDSALEKRLWSGLTANDVGELPMVWLRNGKQLPGEALPGPKEAKIVLDRKAFDDRFAGAAGTLTLDRFGVQTFGEPLSFGPAREREVTIMRILAQELVLGGLVRAGHFDAPKATSSDEYRATAAVLLS